MSHERRSRPPDSLHEAIERFKVTVASLRGVPGALEGRVLDLDREVQDAHLRVRAALDTFGDAAALLSSDGDVILSSNSFEDVGAGRLGEAPAAPLRAMIADHVADPSAAELGNGPRVVRVSLDSPSGRRSFLAQLLDVGDREGTLLLILFAEPGPGPGPGRPPA
jgi:hypothetical protein